METTQTTSEQQDWLPNQPTEVTTLEQMNQLVGTLSSMKEEYDKAKKAATEKYEEYQEQRKIILNTLRANGKRKYEAEGIGLVYITEDSSFTTPKTPEDKAALFHWIEEKYGGEFLTNMLSIHSAKLNSFASEELEGDPLLKIPGLAEPVIEETVTFRRTK